MTDQDKIVDLVRENPRTLKDIAQALGTSKLAALDVVDGLSSVLLQKKTMSFNGRGRPVAVVKYVLK